MNKTTDKKKPSAQPRGTAHKGDAEQAGREVKPSDLTDEAKPGVPAETRHIPIGLPISQEKYDRLKERAKFDRALPKGKAQRDPASRRRT